MNTESNVIPMPAVRPVRQTPVHKFKFQGRVYKLKKLSADRDGNWLTEFQIHGQRYQRSLETNVAAVAERRAIETIIKPALEKRWGVVEAAKVRRSVATIDELCEGFRKVSAGFLGERARQDYAVALKRVLEVGTGRTEVGTLPCTVLDGRLVRTFEAALVRAAAGDTEAEETAKRTVAAYLRQARALVKPHFTSLMQDAGLHLPEFQEFRSAPVRRGKRPEKVRLADDVRAKVEELIARTEGPVGMVLLLAACTLRVRSILAARTEWLQQSGGRWVIRIPAGALKGKRGLDVPISDGTAERLLPQRHGGTEGMQAGGFIVQMEGRRTRDCAVIREANRLLREAGITTPKPLHELRGETARDLNERHGLGVTQTVLGHTAQRTTEENYVGSRVRLEGVVVR